MRKFIVQTLKGVTSVLEVEVREVTSMEDPAVGWSLQPGEKLYLVQAPLSIKGDKYYSWYFFESQEKAMAASVTGLKQDAERLARRAHSELDEAALDLRLKSIKIIML